MTLEAFTTSALAIAARADAATTNEERTAIIANIHQLVRYTPASFGLDVKTALFALEDRLNALRAVA